MTVTYPVDFLPRWHQCWFKNIKIGRIQFHTKKKSVEMKWTTSSNLIFLVKTHDTREKQTSLKSYSPLKKKAFHFALLVLHFLWRWWDLKQFHMPPPSSWSWSRVCSWPVRRSWLARGGGARPGDLLPSSLSTSAQLRTPERNKIEVLETWEPQPKKLKAHESKIRTLLAFCDSLGFTFTSWI